MNNQYLGTELDLFAYAKNWKRYYASILQPYLKGRVLEVGAGIGTTTKSLCRGNYDQWICLEPDPGLLLKIEELIYKNELPSFCKTKNGSISDLNETSLDTIIYIDVLEHIDNDYHELKSCLDSLTVGGSLVILAPAHQWLYSAFDRQIGHYRRYTKQSLVKVVPKGFKCIKLIYIDSVGMLASIANKILLKTANPSLNQILFWDKVLIPISKIVDRLLFFNIGKSLIGVWQKI
jgi:SAM-dependent methyltransferase